MSISLMELALAASLLFSLVALVVALLTARRSAKQLQEAQALIRQISRDLSVANSGAVGMGQRLVAMEKRLREQESKPVATAAAPTPVPDYSGDEDFQVYSEAVRLFRSGASSEEVARRCGLSRAEASLMEVMHQAGR